MECWTAIYTGNPTVLRSNRELGIPSALFQNIATTQGINIQLSPVESHNSTCIGAGHFVTPRKMYSALKNSHPQPTPTDTTYHYQRHERDIRPSRTNTFATCIWCNPYTTYDQQESFFPEGTHGFHRIGEKRNGYYNSGTISLIDNQVQTTAQSKIYLWTW